MKKKIIYAVVATVIVLCVGYSLWLRQGRSLSTELIPTAEALMQNPLPLSSFISGINPRAGVNFDQLCLSLSGRALLKKGQNFREFFNFLASNTSLYINNRPLTPIERSYPYGGFNQMDSGPEDGTVYLCYRPDLEKGIHIGELTTKNTSGAELYYKWAFSIQ